MFSDQYLVEKSLATNEKINQILNRVFWLTAKDKQVLQSVFYEPENTIQVQ